MQPTHCLVFNPVLFNEQCNDRVEHAKAIAAGPSHPMDVQSIVAAWQPSLRDSMHCAFVNRDDCNRVHVQFKGAVTGVPPKSGDPDSGRPSSDILIACLRYNNPIQTPRK